jgi:hypothetical protein
MSRRFIDCATLSPEILGRIDRAVTRAMQDVTLDAGTSANVTVEFRIRYHPHSGEVVADYTLRTHASDSKSRCAGVVRDGQLQLPGTQDLSEFDPETDGEHASMLRRV